MDINGAEEGTRMSVPPEVSGPTTVVTDAIHFDTQGDADMVMSPLGDRGNYFGNFHKADLDMSDPWQFKNFDVTNAD